MTLTAVYKNSTGNYTMSVDDWFDNKADFKAELRANGFTNIRIFTDSEVQKIKKMRYFEPKTATEEYIYNH